MSEKERYAEMAMGKKCANCEGWITFPVSILFATELYKKCECGNSQSALEKAFSGVPVAKYKLGGPRYD